MNITFRLGSETLSDKRIEVVQTKITKLGRFLPTHEDETLVYVDVEREGSATNSESNWKASINLDAAANHFNASAVGSTPDKALDIAIREMKREVSRARAKKESIRKRSGDLLKRLRRGF